MRPPLPYCFLLGPLELLYETLLIVAIGVELSQDSRLITAKNVIPLLLNEQF